MKYNNLYEALIDCAEGAKAEEGFRFLNDDGSERVFLPFKELLSKVQAKAWSLNQLGVRKGDFCGLIIPEQEDFIIHFFALSWLGAVPVPLAVPFQSDKLGHFIENLKHITKIANLKYFIVTPRLKGFLGELLSVGAKKIISPDDLQTGDSWIDPALTHATDLAFLQFTSGSTNQPKGVMVSNSNILANVKCIIEENIRPGAEDRLFSWLPFYHDMGLIGFVITPIIYRVSGDYISPLAFIKRPALWLKSISKYKSTISFAPNFAYSLCSKKIPESLLAELDLSSWRMAGCGAEPIHAQTVKEFTEKFAVCGFQKRAFKACYGLAESTLAVAFPAQEDLPKFDQINEAALSAEKLALPAGPNDKTLSIISCGKSFPGHEISIRNENFEVCPERTVGEVTIKGPSVTSGYINNPEATAEAIRSDGWLLTGDLGYLADGELYICGRKKELIIIAGRNYYPTDIEMLVSEVDGIRKGNVIAFGVSEVDSEKLVVCAEAKQLSEFEKEATVQEIKSRINNAIGIMPFKIKLLPVGALPKTSSGKLQRSKTKNMFICGDFDTSLMPSSTKPMLTAIKISYIWIKSKAGYLFSGLSRSR